MVKCRVYKIEGGMQDEFYSYLVFIPSHQPKKHDDLFIPQTYPYGSSDGTLLGVWDFNEEFLKRLDIIYKPRLKIKAYQG